MNKRPGTVIVTTEVGYCSFCGRPRNLRREDHQLGTLVRSIVTCETCHRTLSSTVGVASAEPAEPSPVPVETAKAPSPLPAASRPAPPASGKVKKPEPAVKKAAQAKTAAKAKATAKPGKPAPKRTTTKSATKKK